MSGHQYVRFVSYFLPAALFPTVLFLGMPWSLFVENAEYFSFDVLFPFLIAFIASLLLICIAYMNVSLKRFSSHLLFFSGLYFLFSDVLAPVQLPELAGTKQAPAEPLLFTAVDVGLLVAAIILAIMLPRHLVARTAPTIAGAIIFGQIFVAFSPLVGGKTFSTVVNRDKRSIGEPVLGEVSKPPAYGGVVADRPNVYHLVFDAFSSVGFMEAIEHLSASEKFEGFVFFPENRSNHVETTMSVASFMTGTFFEGDGLHEWMEAWKRGVGVVGEMLKAGYMLSSYEYNFCLDGASYCLEKKRIINLVGLERPEMLHFADLWFLRVAPNYLQAEAYSDGKGIFSWLAERLATGTNATDVLWLGENLYPYYSIAMFRKMIADEASRPAIGQYVKGHFLVPHGPYIVDGDCRYRENVTYFAQATCTLRMVTEFLDELKRLGRYDSSIILVHADHGSWPVCRGKDLDTLDKAMDEAIRRSSVRGYAGVGIDCAIRTLLLIKPPNASGGPLASSMRETQLADIPATLYDLADVDVKTPVGVSVLAPDFPENRDIHIFIGYRQSEESGDEILFGRDFKKGVLDHYVYRRSAGWIILGDMEATW